MPTGTILVVDDEPNIRRALRMVLEPEGYALLDAAAGIRLGPVEVSLLGRNLLDEAYLVSPDSRAVLAPGLTGVLSLGVRF